jgi:hypothetical protein
MSYASARYGDPRANASGIFLDNAGINPFITSVPAEHSSFVFSKSLFVPFQANSTNLG